MVVAMEACSYFDLIDDDEMSFGTGKTSPEFFTYLDNEDVSMAVNIDDLEILEMYTAYVEVITAKQRRETMKGLLHYDLTDMPVMIGAAFFVSSSFGVLWNLVANSSPPSGLTIVSAVAGLFIGRMVSMKARKAR